MYFLPVKRPLFSRKNSFNSVGCVPRERLLSKCVTVTGVLSLDLSGRARCDGRVNGKTITRRTYKVRCIVTLRPSANARKYV